MIALIDVTGSPPNLHRIWAGIGFTERLERLCGHLIIWRSEKEVFETGFLVISSMQDLINCVVKTQSKVVVYLGWNQLFVDIGIVDTALNKSMTGKVDYFTQWEHCRLPVGIGIRAFSIETFVKSGVRNPSDFINYVKRNPDKFNIKYDDTAYVDYEVSLLDSRYSEELMRRLDGHRGSASFDLGGFLSLLEKGIGEMPIYSPNENSPPLDERQMSAPYGFESRGCAEFPTYIMFDVTNQCNSACIHCPHSVTFQNKSRPAYLDFGIYMKVIDESREKVTDFVRITADGEPLLHPKLLNMIDYAVKEEVGPVGLTTNGSLMSQENAKSLAESGLFMVDISLDAIRKETYNKIRRGLSFEKVMKNIDFLLEYKAKINSPLKVMVSFVKQASNMNELKAFEEYWEPKVDKVLIREIISNVNAIDTSDSWRSKNTQRWPCPHWFRRIVISYDGLIKACPVDWENATAYKSIQETSIFDAWHSDSYWRNRMAHLNNTFSPGSICKDCNDWKGSPWNLGYEKAIKTLR